jgi:EAL domain-containing protein (putative c-di-GMP-specific phosphodiesterase class I)
VSVILSSALEPKLLASVANMAQAYKVKLLGVMNKPPSAVKLSRLVQQFLAAGASSDDAGEDFTLAEIAEAFAADEFEPFFQPTVSLANLRVKGFEAIPHWRHPTRGPIRVDLFLPALKTYGLADDLVWTMLRKCAAHCRTWREAGLQVKVFLKLALGSLTDPHLASKIEKTVVEERAEPGALVLGIVENAVDVSAARALENMVRLRLHGFDLAIDEFGTGAMEPDQLARVAFNELKISRNLVGLTGGGKPVWGGLAAALDTAEQLKLLAVADGITTPDDWNLLQEWKCHFGQGPLISGPLQAESVTGWLNRWPPKPQRGVWTPAPVL